MLQGEEDQICGGFGNWIKLVSGTILVDMNDMNELGDMNHMNHQVQCRIMSLLT